MAKTLTILNPSDIDENDPLHKALLIALGLAMLAATAPSITYAGTTDAEKGMARGKHGIATFLNALNALDYAVIKKELPDTFSNVGEFLKQ